MPLYLDLVVINLVIVECKATTQYNTIFEAQTLTYLRLTRLRLEFMINTGDLLVKNGIHRVVNTLSRRKAQRRRAPHSLLIPLRPCAFALISSL